MILRATVMTVGILLTILTATVVGMPLTGGLVLVTTIPFGTGMVIGGMLEAKRRP